MKRIGLLLTHVFLFYGLHAQYENVWVFGRYHAGLDFNYDPPRFFESAIDGFGEGSASVCDVEGKLLFYTDGTFVWNKQHDYMAGGNYILPVATFGNGTGSPTASCAQGALIVKKPFSEHLYYVFSLLSAEQYASIENFERTRNFGRLYYSLVDMRLNNGLGAVVDTQKGIPLDSFLYEHMTVVRGAGCELWVVVLSRVDNALKAFRVDYNGIDLLPVSSPLDLQLQTEPTGGAPGYLGFMSWAGKIRVNSRLNKLAITDSQNPVDTLRAFYLVDFDNSTGIGSNAMMIDNNESFYDACFSSNDSLLYIAGLGSEGLNQYEIYHPTAPMIRRSKINLGVGGHSVKMARGDKIYFYNGGGMGRVNFPNIRGSGCSMEPDAIPIPDSLSHIGIHIGLPNEVGVLDTSKIQHHVQTFSHNLHCFAPITLEPRYAGTRNEVIWLDSIDSNTLTVSKSGTYWVRYHDYENCSTFTDSFYVSIPKLEVHTRAACSNGNTGMAWVEVENEDSVQYNWIWINESRDTLATGGTLRDVPAGNYWLVLKDSACEWISDVTIEAIDANVSFIPARDLSFEDLLEADPITPVTIICQGDSLTFYNTSDTHFTSFVWSFGDGASVWAEPPSAPGFHHLKHAFVNSGTYLVTLKGDGAVCADTAYATITVDSMRPAAFEVAPDAACVGQPLVFTPFLDSTTAALYWTFSHPTGTPFTYDASSRRTRLQRVYQHAFDQAGMHEVILHEKFRACPDTIFSRGINVYPFPEVDLGDDSSICLHGAPVYLKNLRPLPNAYHRYLWSTGDTTQSLEVVDPGTYTLSVITEPIGCTTTESIKVAKDCYIDIPNAFTPDGDGHNDYFFPRQLLSERVHRFRMQVFNRWGQLLFETGNLDGRGWDGRFNGKDQPMGVYLYRIEADFSNGRQEQYEGNVTLVR